LRVFQAGGNGIRADEAAEGGVIIECAVVVETGCVQALAGELLIGGKGTGDQPGPAKRREFVGIQLLMCQKKPTTCWISGAGGRCEHFFS
jgi:hypothetical protein